MEIARFDDDGGKGGGKGGSLGKGPRKKRNVDLPNVIKFLATDYLSSSLIGSGGSVIKMISEKSGGYSSALRLTNLALFFCSPALPVHEQ